MKTEMLKGIFTAALLMSAAVSSGAEPDKVRAGDWALRIDQRSIWFTTAPDADGAMTVLWGGSSPVPSVPVRGADGRITLERSYSHPDHPDWAWTRRLTFRPSDGDEMDCEYFETRANRPGRDIRAKGVAKLLPPLPKAPDLTTVNFGEPVDLLANGLDGWEPMGTRTSTWVFVDGVLENRGSGGANIRTKRDDFTDFKLSYDVRVDKGCNSGVYLRGLYEIQTLDSYGRAPDSHNMGAVYGRVTPTVTADRPTGEWQHVEAILCDRHITVVLNGVKIIDNAPVRGPTGGAVSPDPYVAGPIYIQGDHKGGAYRNIVLRPVVSRKSAGCGEWDEARAEWARFRESYEPDYSDGSKYLQPEPGHRFDEPFRVVKNGKPCVKIVWRKSGWWRDDLSTKVTETAAKELQSLIKLLTGVEVPVCGSFSEGPDVPVIGVGKGLFFPFDQRWMITEKQRDKRLTPDVIRTVNDDLKALRGSDGYAIRQFGRDLFVYGTCEKGAMNGVYKLIENNTDIIFSRPDQKSGTVFTPLNGDLSFVWGKDARERPYFTMRGFWNRAQPRYRNANYLNMTDSPEWTDERPFCRGSHNSGQFVPPASERPDLHGLVSGRRGDYGHMLCFSNPELKSIYRERVVAHMDHRQPSAMRGMNIYLDDTKNWCECDACAKPIVLPDGQTVSKDDPAFMCTQWFLLLNDSARALADAYPGMMVHTLAYFQTVIAPRCPVERNIDVGFCPYPRPDDSAPVSSESNAWIVDRLRGWAKKVERSRLFLRGYDGLGYTFPRPLGHTRRLDWKLYAPYVCGMHHESGATAGPDRIEKGGKPSRAATVFDYSSIEFWTMARQLWNPDADVEALYKKFCWRTYREGAPAMERFFGTIRQDWIRRGLPSSIGEDGMNATKVYIIDSGRESELRGYLDSALASVRHPVSRGLIERVKGRFEHFISEVKNAKTSSLTVPLQDRAADPGFDDADWKGSAVIDRFHVLSRKPDADGESSHPARVELSQDGKSLYLRATLWEDMSQIASTPPAPGVENVFGSMFEVFLGDNCAPGTYRLFRVDNAGGIVDCIGYDPAWNRKETQISVRRFEDRWVVVMKIPFREIGMNIIADNKLKAAFLRTWKSSDPKSNGEYSGWKFNRFHKLSTFGTLILQK